MLCHLWHGQGLYWAFVGMSVWNLVSMALDRHCLVCRPFKYIQMTQRDWYKHLLAYVGFGLFALSGGILQVRYEEGYCTPKFITDGHEIKNYMLFFAIAAFLMAFLFPSLLLICLYAKVIYTMKYRNNDESNPASRTVDKASKEILKTAIIVSVIFILTLGYDLTYYILGYTGVLEYKVGSAPQKIGVLLAALNNCINPFVYVILMPNYRRNVKEALGLCAKCKNKTRDESERSTVSATVSTMF